ncbi:putative phosphorylase [Plectosphaerella plurivora]|uniref:Phosphorylase n=1 Tax=Plectosphaerella plurivora TaxID=936078 RepID=A0A9P9A879_9PEZI|nr:putative phosphorylase [Plectosphaerella plurivora]
MLNVLFDEAEALRRFDKLVDLGIMRYMATSASAHIDDGFPYTIRVCNSWAHKPAVVGASTSNGTEEAPETFGPGSDINNSHPDQTVGQLNDTHLVILNIFPAVRPQYLLLTLDSYRSQYEPLQYEDISASWTFLHSLEVPHVALYNCTPSGGCSRVHKHVQVLPYPVASEQSVDEESFRLFPDNSNGNVRVPYTHFLHRFDNQSARKSRQTSREVFDIYTKLLNQAKQCLEFAAGDTSTPCPHNVILVKNWILVIPRRAENKSGFMTNGLGMMGNIVTSNAEQAQKWLDKGVSAALAECGIPPQA